jgi:hypothetical protein
MRYENSLDTEVQKIDIFPYLSIQKDHKEKGSFEKSNTLEKNRSTENKKEIVQKLIKYFKNA